MVESIPKRSIRSKEIRWTAVDEINIHPTVLVVIEERTTGAYSLRQISIRRMSAIVNPGYAALTGRDFFEGDVRLRCLRRSDGEAQKQRQDRQGKLSRLVVF